MRLCKNVFSLSLLLVLTLLLVAVPTGHVLASEGGGGGGESDRSAPKKQGTPSTQWKGSVVQTILEHANKDGLDYYFQSKRRMRRLLDRMYKEETERTKVPRAQQAQSQYWLIFGAFAQTIRNGKKYNVATKNRAKKILSAYNQYSTYKDGKMTKNDYKKVMENVLGFVP